MTPFKKQALKEQDLFEKLRQINQEHLLKDWDLLNISQKNHLLKQIEHLDIELFKKQQGLLSDSSVVSEDYEFFLSNDFAGNSDDSKLGEEALAQGKCACVILAGGQGSRFGCVGPKGCIPISPVKNKTLFALLAEKIRAASKQFGRPLRAAIMTSPLNHEETKNYFIKNKFFGLQKDQVTFFSQELWPVLDFSGNLFLEDSENIACGPNGNATVWRLLIKENIIGRWSSNDGVEYINVVPVDNPLALPFDSELLGFQIRNQSDLVIKASYKRADQNNVGVVVKRNGKIGVVEYSEMSQSSASQVIANLGLYSFSLPFVIENAFYDVPLHKAKKVAKKEGFIPKEPNCWKFEEFIFDIFPNAKSYNVLLYNQDSIFAPLKNLSGSDSIDSVKRALLRHDREVYSNVTGVRTSGDAYFELASDFYYPTKDLLTRWRGVKLPDREYIEA